ncbi:g5442 [Coccomyxa elongata]
MMQFLSRPFVVGDRIDIASGSGAKFATGYVERVDPIYTVLRTDTGLPVTIPNKGLDNYACNIFVLVHTTPPFSRDFGAFRQRLLLDLTACVRKHGAQLAAPRQVNEVPQMDGVASVLQQWVDQSKGGAESGVHAKSSHKSENGSGGKSGGNVYNANTWLFGSSDD